METEKPEECESCDFKTADLVAYRTTRNFPKRPCPDKWLCNLCASTIAGNAYEYPEQFPVTGDVVKTICFVGNTILAAIATQAQGSKS